MARPGECARLMVFEANFRRRKPQSRGDGVMAGMKRERFRLAWNVEHGMARSLARESCATANRADRFLQHKHHLGPLTSRRVGLCAGKKDGGSNRRVAREGQFGLGREYAYARRVKRVVGRKYKHSFRKIELGGDRLHRGSVEAGGIQHYGERIACKRCGSKDVKNGVTAGQLGGASICR